MGGTKKRQELLKHLFLSKDSPVAFTSATKVYEYLRYVLGIFDIPYATLEGLKEHMFVPIKSSAMASIGFRD